MGGRDFPWDEKAECDYCGIIGAYYCMSDYVCVECLNDEQGLTEDGLEGDIEEFSQGDL